MASGASLGRWMWVGALVGALVGGLPLGPAASWAGTVVALNDRCTARFLDRDVQVNSNGTIILPNMPVPTGLFRLRVTCNVNGEVVSGESDYVSLIARGVTQIPSIRLGTGVTPIPRGISIIADDTVLNAPAQTLQLTVVGLLPDGTVRNLTPRSAGTTYLSSNPRLASVGQDGLVTATFTAGQSGNVIISASNEGTQATLALRVGAAGILTGIVFAADGTTPVTNANVALFRSVPFGQLDTLSTNDQGRYTFSGAPLGALILRASDPATGHRAQVNTALSTNGERREVNITLSGLGRVVASVLDNAGQDLRGAVVTLTSRVPGTAPRFATTASPVAFDSVPAGAFDLSARDPGTGLVGFTNGSVNAGGSTDVTIRIQAVGSIAGTVRGPDGTTPAPGKQVRLLSALLGLAGQGTTANDGSFRLDGLPLNGSPYTLDALDQGRRRARATNLSLTTPGQALTQNLTLVGQGRVRGTVRNPDGSPNRTAVVTVQSLNLTFAVTLTANPDAQGNYAIDGVPVGDFTVAAVDAPSRLRADAAGRITSDGQEVTRDLLLAISNSGALTGTVFNRDGRTAVGAGVSVRLTGPDNGTTTTNAAGQFRFEPVALGSYSLEASDAAGNRGRTFATVSFSGQVFSANIFYLGRGTVSGLVRRDTGEGVPNASVNLGSSSLFGGSQATTTDSNGRYSFFDVFVGPFSVSAQVPVSPQFPTGGGGFANGSISSEGQQVTADITLQTAGTGTVRGTVFRSDRTTRVAGANVTLQGRTATTDSDGGFQFAFVPLGGFTLEAADPATGDRGRATSQLIAANETRTVNVILNGLGRAIATVRTAGGSLVQGANVTLQGTTQFGGTQARVTGADGTATFEGVFAGGFNVSATDPVSRLSGFTSSSVNPGQTANVAVTLEAAGTIRGVVSGPAGTAPPPGTLVNLRRSGLGLVAQATASASGEFRFDVVPVGGSPYTLDAVVNGRLRARESGITLATQGQEVTRDITLVGIGTVSGLVTLNGTPVAGIGVSLQSLAPLVGGFFSATTNGAGSYAIGEVPLGSFTATVNDPGRQLIGQAAGSLTANGQTATANIALASNASNTPITRFDASDFTYDIQRNGSLLNGTSQVFRGDLGQNQGGQLLDLVFGGIPVRFAADSAVATTELDGRQVVVRQTNIQGLNVTRKIYVPRDGYFARYLEILENATDQAIAVDVRLLTNLRGFNGSPRVIATSSGDDLLAANEDLWAVFDDGADNDPFLVSGTPAVAHVFGGADGAERAALAELEVIDGSAQVNTRWNFVQIPAGGRVAFLHFVSQQTSRAAARASGERLVQLPPEALFGLTPNELGQIRNFSAPLDGLSALGALPRLDGTVTGRVFEGDDETPAPGAGVRYMSRHPLFGRTFSFGTDGRATFGFTGSLNDFGSSVAVPAADFALKATHPVTGAESPEAIGAFLLGETTATRDIVFSNLGLATGIVRRSTGEPVRLFGGNVVARTSPGGAFAANVGIGPDDGQYRVPGLRPGRYTFEATIPHPQGTGLTGSAAGDILAGQVTRLDISLPPTSELRGVVQTGTGAPAPNVQVQLFRDNFFRSTFTDSGGQYVFPDLPFGQFTVRSFEPNTGIPTNPLVTIGADPVTQNLALIGLGTVRAQVNFARGAGAPNARVQIREAARGNFFFDVGATDATGLRVIENVPVGDFAVRGFHPENGNLFAEVAGMTVAGQTVDATAIFLPAAGRVSGRVLVEGTGIGNVPVRLQVQGGPSFNTTSDSSGNYAFAGIPLGSVTVTANDPFRQVFGQVAGNLTTDGQVLTLDIAASASTIPLPATLFDANDFGFDVQRGAETLRGQNSVFGGDFGANQGAALLDIVVGGNATRFTGSASGLLEVDRRQVAVQQANVAGLNVTRKVYVPRDGYFARYLEILSNPTADLITLDVRLTTHHRSFFGSPRVIRTSSGDATLDVADRWVVIDDDQDGDPFVIGGIPATAQVFVGPNAPQGTGTATFGLLGGGPGRTILAATGVTIPAGGNIALLHFLVQQTSRAAAQAAAERLVQLPPEALFGLSAGEQPLIRNFVVPPSTPMAALASLGGRVSGRVLAADQATAIPNTFVQLRSSHPLFGRTYALNADGEGRFVFNARLTGQGNSLVVPEADFTLTATHPETGVTLQRVLSGAFAPDATRGNLAPGQATDASSNLGGSFRPDLAVDGNLNTSWISSSGDAANLGRSPFFDVFFAFDAAVEQVNVRGNRAFGCCFVTRGAIELFGRDGALLASQEFDTAGPNRDADVDVPDQAGVRHIRVRTLADQDSVSGFAELQVIGISNRPVAAADLAFTNTGTLTGTVRRATGAAVSSGTVQISGGSPFISRNVSIQGDGTYRQSGAPPGNYTLTAFVGGNTGTRNATVMAGETTTADITLNPTGTVSGVVRDGGGNPAGGVTVDLFRSGFFQRLGTDGAGRYQFTEVPIGSFTLRAFEPNTGILTSAPVTVAADQTTTQDLQLVGVGAVRVQVNRSTGVGVGNAQVNIQDARGFFFFAGFTDASGLLVRAGVAVGPVTVRAFVPGTNFFGEATGTLGPHGATLDLTIPLPPIGSVAGRVTRPTGAAAPFGSVRLFRADSSFDQFVGSDGDGRFTFPSVPGSQPLTLQAHHPQDFGIFREIPNLTIPSDGAAVTQDVTVPAVATLRLTVRREDGSAQPDARIEIRDAFRTFNRFAGFTNPSGQLDIGNVPEGAFTILARDRSTFEFLASGSGTIAAANDGQVVEFTLTLTGLIGTVEGTVRFANGVTPAASAFLELFDRESGFRLRSTNADQQGRYSFTSVRVGAGGFRVLAHSPINFGVTVEGTGTFATQGETVMLDLTLPQAAIQGTVRYSDDTPQAPAPVPFPNVTVQQGEIGFFTLANDAQGGYIVAGLGVGDFTAQANDFNTGATAMRTGRLDSLDQALTLDFTLDVGTVQGTVFRADGTTTVPSAFVFLTVQGGVGEGGNQQGVQADDQGRYRFQRVAVGSFTVDAEDPASGVFGSATGQIGLVNETVTVDVRLAATGTIRGTVRDPLGNPVANAQVTIRNPVGGAFGGFSRTVTADANGRYEAADVPEGATTITAESPDRVRGGTASAVVPAGGTVDLDITLDAIRLPRNLDGLDGFRYDVSGDGSLNDGGTVDRRLNDAYDGSYHLRVGANGFPFLEFARADESGRVLTLGPAAMGGLLVSRQVFVPAAGKFARYLEILQNSSGAPITVQVEVRSNLGSDSSTRIVVAPDATNPRFAVTDQRGFCCDPALAHVFAGPGARIAPSAVQFLQNNDDIFYRYNVTVPAGETVAVMHFAIQRDLPDTAGAQTQAEALVNLTDADALVGLGAAERARILNFNVPAP